MDRGETPPLYLSTMTSAYFYCDATIRPRGTRHDYTHTYTQGHSCSAFGPLYKYISKDPTATRTIVCKQKWLPTQTTTTRPWPPSLPLVPSSAYYKIRKIWRRAFTRLLRTHGTDLTTSSTTAQSPLGLRELRVGPAVAFWSSRIATTPERPLT